MCFGCFCCGCRKRRRQRHIFILLLPTTSIQCILSYHCKTYPELIAKRTNNLIFCHIIPFFSSPVLMWVDRWRRSWLASNGFDNFIGTFIYRACLSLRERALNSPHSLSFSLTVCLQNCVQSKNTINTAPTWYENNFIVSCAFELAKGKDDIIRSSIHFTVIMRLCPS